MNPNDPRSRTRRRSGLTALVLTCAIILSGCGVRLETPPPTEPVPDAAEVVRRTAVADALLVAETAEAAAGAEGVGGDVADALGRVAAATTAQAEQLGGEYDSGLDDIVADRSASSPSATAPERTPAAVLTSLVDAATRTRAAANQAQPGPLARLLASISAAQTRDAWTLARLTRGEAPELPPTQIPEPADPDAEQTGDESPATASASGAQDAPVVPGGLSAEDLSAVVVAEDSAGYALEVRAAQASGDLRSRAQDRARLHRARAQAWALVAGVDGTDQDPRQVAYAVPGTETSTQDLARDLEAGLAQNYASLTGRAEPGTRAVLVALLTDVTIAGAGWGAEAVPFPGLPEQA
ncbi:DUF4439 domain-containing protein [Promicromonospora thailandica]|uniref:DUF4439 domain-containing protein n=1 Tax=Promicromonospora thailandica TaxID=765201 RepID=A0A9X2JUU1_9MICO|nr:DUF4439 domain-containing protein [Promicromonospora thailandica]MCP2263852.1 protein of unknown function (DUF4439) [Promicromonospora thailandica]